MFDVGCWMLDVGCWMLDVGCWMFTRAQSALPVLISESQLSNGLRTPRKAGAPCARASRENQIKASLPTAAVAGAAARRLARSGPDTVSNPESNFQPTVPGRRPPTWD